MLTKIRIYLKLVSLLFQTAFLSKSTGVFYKSCGLCKGIVHTKKYANEDLNTGLYMAQFKCNNCGAVGTLHEEWSK